MGPGRLPDSWVLTSHAIGCQGVEMVLKESGADVEGMIETVECPECDSGDGISHTVFDSGIATVVSCERCNGTGRVPITVQG